MGFPRLALFSCILLEYPSSVCSKVHVACCWCKKLSNRWLCLQGYIFYKWWRILRDGDLSSFPAGFMDWNEKKSKSKSDKLEISQNLDTYSFNQNNRVLLEKEKYIIYHLFQVQLHFSCALQSATCIFIKIYAKWFKQSILSLLREGLRCLNQPCQCKFVYCK